MDLNQQKLNRTEWDTTEIPVNKDEAEILNLIIKGYDNVNITYNKNNSMINFLSLDPNENIMNHLYKEYFQPIISKMNIKYDFTYSDSDGIKFQRVNSIEKLKLENINKSIKEKMSKIFEFDLLTVAELVMRYFYKDNMSKFNKYYYTLHHLMRLSITHINNRVISFIESVLADYYVELNKEGMFLQSSDLIE